jgi:hypothetical protein
VKMVLTPAGTPDEYVACLDNWQQAQVQALRAAVLESVPRLEERLKWGHLVYFLNGPVLLIRAEPQRVLFGFWRGQKLRHIEPRLKPGGKYQMATLQLVKDTPLERATVLRLAQEASALNQSDGDPTQDLPAEAPKRPGVDGQIDTFLAKYSPEIASQLRDARQHLRSLFPRGHELVFDNYNALVFAVSPSERSTDAFVSVAGYPKWVTLFFSHGVDLDDPEHLLEGTGSRVRSIRLKSADHLLQPAVRALIEQAATPLRHALLDAAPLSTTIKMVSAKQRPRVTAKSPAAQRRPSHG